MSVGAFPPGRDGNPSYSQHTPANARVQGLWAMSVRRGGLRFGAIFHRGHRDGDIAIHLSAKANVF